MTWRRLEVSSAGAASLRSAWRSSERVATTSAEGNWDAGLAAASDGRFAGEARLGLAAVKAALLSALARGFRRGLAAGFASAKLADQRLIALSYSFILFQRQDLFKGSKRQSDRSGLMNGSRQFFPKQPLVERLLSYQLIGEIVQSDGVARKTLFYTPWLRRRRRHAHGDARCGRRHFLKDHITRSVHFQSEMAAMKGLETFEHLEIIAGGKEQVGIAGANRYVRDNVGDVRGDDRSHTRGNFLVASHRVGDDYGRAIVGFSLDFAQAVDDVYEPLAFTAADDLPVAQLRRFAQERLQVVEEHREHEAQAAATHHFFAEQGDGPRFGFEGLAKLFGFGLEQLIGRIDCPA